MAHPASHPLLRRGALSLIVLVVLLSGCRREPTAVCLHVFDDPVLTVGTATDTETGSSIPQIRIREVRINSVPYPPELLARGGSNVSVDDDALLCDPPCGFGTVEGVYRLQIRAPDYDWAGFRFQASYQTFNPGCPSSSAGGDTVAVQLMPR